MIKIQAYIQGKAKKSIDTLARGKGITFSDMLRRIIEFYFNNHKGDK